VLLFIIEPVMDGIPTATDAEAAARANAATPLNTLRMRFSSTEPLGRDRVSRSSNRSKDEFPPQPGR
jgi:hypothetical protein